MTEFVISMGPSTPPGHIHTADGVVAPAVEVRLATAVSQFLTIDSTNDTDRIDVIVFIMVAEDTY